MSGVSKKKLCDLPHGYVLYQLDYVRNPKGDLNTGDTSKSLNDSRIQARREEYEKRPANQGKPLKELHGDTKSFTR